MSSIREAFPEPQSSSLPVRMELSQVGILALILLMPSLRWIMARTARSTKVLALSSAADRLYATNFHADKVEIYDQSFTEIDTGTTFVDPTIPTGYAPFGIQNISGSIYVSYAKQDADKHDDVAGAGHGYVSVFDANGNFTKRLITRPFEFSVGNCAGAG